MNQNVFFGSRLFSQFIISVISSECLNQKSEWNLDYFNRLRLAISTQKNEFKYTLSDIKEEPLKKLVFCN